MFIIMKNASKLSPNFGDALKSVVEHIYQDLATAQQSAMDLANTHIGDSYTVFELVMFGTAIAPPAPPSPQPAAVWMPVINPVL